MSPQCPVDEQKAGEYLIVLWSQAVSSQRALNKGHLVIPLLLPSCSYVHTRSCKAVVEDRLLHYCCIFMCRLPSPSFLFPYRDFFCFLFEIQTFTAVVKLVNIVENSCLQSLVNWCWFHLTGWFDSWGNTPSGFLVELPLA